jgi:anti-sigma factor RsiW
VSDVTTRQDGRPIAATLDRLGQFQCIDPEVGELLPFHVGGGLPADDRALVAAHLQACLRCAEDARLMTGVVAGIASLRAHPEPAAAASPAPAAQRRPRLLIAVAASAAVIAALALWSRGQGREHAAVRVAEAQALEARVEHLEAQNASLSRAIARERAGAMSPPFAGIPIAAPPNL